MSIFGFLFDALTKLSSGASAPMPNDSLPGSNGQNNPLQGLSPETLAAQPHEAKKEQIKTEEFNIKKANADKLAQQAFTAAVSRDVQHQQETDALKNAPAPAVVPWNVQLEQIRQSATPAASTAPVQQPINYEPE